MGHYSYPLNDHRERQLDKLEAAVDANTRADAIDAAVAHYLESIENLEAVADEISPQLAKKISTSEVSLTYYPQVR